MNTTTAGRLLGVSAHQVARLARAGLLPGAHKVGRQWVIPDQAVAEALRNRPARAQRNTPRSRAEEGARRRLLRLLDTLLSEDLTLSKATNLD